MSSKLREKLKESDVASAIELALEASNVRFGSPLNFYVQDNQTRFKRQSELEDTGLDVWTDLVASAGPVGLAQVALGLVRRLESLPKCYHSLYNLFSST